MTSATCDEHVRHKAGCRSCQIRAAELGRARTRAIAYGTHRGLQNPAAARAHVLHLHEQYGMSLRRIAEQAGVNKECVRRLAGGESGSLQPATNDRILAVRPDGEIRDRDYVPAVGAARRLQALSALGHHIDKIAAEMGVRPADVARWRRMYRAVILASTDRTIRATYRTLANIDGGDDRTRSIARAEGWVPPVAWDSDEAMDDPSAQPDQVAVRALVPEVLAGRLTVEAFTPDERLRVVEYLIALRYTDVRIAEKLRWAGGGRTVAQYRRRFGLLPGSRRGESKGAARYAREQRRERFLRLAPAEKSAAIDRFDFDGEAVAQVADAIGCSVSAVESRRLARAARRDAEADPVAVQYAVAGKLRFSDLNRAEKVLLFGTVGQERSMTELTTLLRISATTYRNWMDQVADAGVAA